MVSSFPENLNRGLDRATAVLILNSSLTGHPEALMEASIINAKRTAASAALAAECLLQDDQIDCAGVIGCGLINYETVRFITTVAPRVRRLALYDLNEERARRFKVVCEEFADDIEVASSIGAVLKQARLISFATTGSSPHVFNPADFSPRSLVLLISLRDLSPEVIQAGFNVVVVADHVTRERTSIHLTEQLVGNRDFINCSIGDILIGATASLKDRTALTIYSPFGLGILDVAVGQYLYLAAKQAGAGTVIDSFLPKPWIERTSAKK